MYHLRKVKREYRFDVWVLEDSSVLVPGESEFIPKYAHKRTRVVSQNTVGDMCFELQTQINYFLDEYGYKPKVIIVSDTYEGEFLWMARYKADDPDLPMNRKHLKYETLPVYFTRRTGIIEVY